MIRSKILADIAQAVVEVEEGNVQALPTYRDLKVLEDAIKKSLDVIKEQATEEAEAMKGERMDGKTIGVHVATRYDFKHIEAWRNKKAELTAIEEQAKNAYFNGLKGIQSVTADGEVIEPAVRSQTESPKFNK